MPNFKGPAIYENNYIWLISENYVELTKLSHFFPQNKSVWTIKTIGKNFGFFNPSSIQLLALDGYHLVLVSLLNQIYVIQKWTLRKRFSFHVSTETKISSLALMGKIIIISTIDKLLFYSWRGNLLLESSTYPNITCLAVYNGSFLDIRTKTTHTEVKIKQHA